MNAGLKIALLAGAFLVGTACRQDMHDQPRYRNLSASDYYSDGRGSRPAVPNTVARGQLKVDHVLYAGKIGKEDADRFPFPMTKEVLERGRNRFNIFCSPCHGYTGHGNGMIPRRGLQSPPSYHSDALREAPVGHFFDVISNGTGAMASYAARIPDVKDRWSIVGYIRVLQQAQNAKIEDVPVDMRSKVEAMPQQ